MFEQVVAFPGRVEVPLSPGSIITGVMVRANRTWFAPFEDKEKGRLLEWREHKGKNEDEKTEKGGEAAARVERDRIINGKRA